MRSRSVALIRRRIIAPSLSARLQRPDARVHTQPFAAAPLVGVDVSVALAGTTLRPRGRDRRVAIHVDRQLVDDERRRRVLPEILDVALHLPHLAGGSIEVREGRREDRLQHLPRALATCLDEPQVTIAESLHVDVGPARARTPEQPRARPWIPSHMLAFRTDGPQ